MDKIEEMLIKYCDDIIYKIDNVLKVLGSALKFVFFDIFKGSVISSFFKYIKIEKSKEILQSINTEILRLKDKLQYFNLNIEASEFRNISSLNSFLTFLQIIYYRI